jgi:C4-dicarboxylate transporter DctM subunit
MTLTMTLVFLALVLLGTPMYVAIGLAGTAGIFSQGKYPITVVVQQMVAGIDSWVLLAVPLFILAGNLMETGGISSRVINLAKVLVGHVRGGLGLVTVAAVILFAGISGSAAADTAAIGSIVIPAMIRVGFAPSQAAAIVAAAVPLGSLIPPCISMIVLASMVSMSVAQLFMAGFVPAFIVAIPICAYIYWDAKRKGLPNEPRVSLRVFVAVVGDSVLAMGMPLVIVGPILLGITTPTEASAMAVIYALIVGVFVYKEVTIAQLPGLLVKTAVTTGFVMFLVSTARVAAWIFASEQLPQVVANFLLSYAGGKVTFLLLANVLLLFFGSIMEGLPAMILLLPVLFPIGVSLGVHPLHFAIIIMANLGVSHVMPPVGYVLYMACAIGGCKLSDLTRAFVPYLVILLIMLFTIIPYVPWFTLVLPKLFLAH